MTELSLQAQAVYDAYRKAAARPYYYERSGLVAALRAAADQVVPEPLTQRSPCREHCIIGGAAEQIRAKLLAIAAELEAGYV